MRTGSRNMRELPMHSSVPHEKPSPAYCATVKRHMVKMTTPTSKLFFHIYYAKTHFETIHFLESVTEQQETLTLALIKNEGHYPVEVKHFDVPLISVTQI